MQPLFGFYVEPPLHLPSLQTQGDYTTTSACGAILNPNQNCTLQVVFHTPRRGAQAVTLRNVGDADMAVTAITVSGDFATQTDCGASLAPAAHCAAQVVFTPVAAGRWRQVNRRSTRSL